MKKESLSSSMAKLIMVVSFIVGIGAVMGLMGYLNSIPKINNSIKFPIIGIQKTCEVNSDCYKYSPCGKVFTCLSKSDYDKAMKNKPYVMCTQEIVNPWRQYKHNKEECSCSKNSCTNVYSNERHCQSLEESLKWCGDDKPFDYEYYPDENECQEMKNLFDDNCIDENDIKDETVDWKTYRNEEYNYEFKYPDNLLIDEEVSKNHVYLWTKEQFAIFKNGEITDSILWVTSDSLNDLSLENYIKTKKTEISEKEYLNFNNLEILRIYEQGYGKGTNIYYIASEEEVVIIGTVLDKKNTVISQILTTFEFIEKEELTDWKTYRNEEVGFEFKYPKDYMRKNEEMTNFAIGSLRNNYDVYMTAFDTQIDYDENFGMNDFNIKIINNPDRLSLSKWFEKNAIEKFGTKNAILSSIDDQKIIVDGIEGIDRIILGGGGNVRSIIVSKDDRIISLNIDSTNSHPNYRDGSFEKNKLVNGYERIEEFNQIIDTFKFID
ncbi:hypothetical protein KAJ41_00105 [Candidatus Parcubacteria bacterium]|nr:hypothetical protein [Candidatus Parcubacteria bacterium]